LNSTPTSPRMGNYPSSGAEEHARHGRRLRPG
jgi:hypothetical protein